ncbi:peptidylprolyl isomerase RRD1 [Sugiyamaella lignohabitans]|uniref:Serine/threonine-protein phosphatase 2A activator n=1 Tax=Sugiyamaella lignohabitans TaxID=796027 RepID=A0A167C0D2_9ASCO|nr:peptidylprolyl isomerase RRD1 [Sugiyamaella lignohabitans]ANB11059.1 peptidylprolyl isomerase RRD1 [Sugiyamaella lignohabitans]
MTENIYNGSIVSGTIGTPGSGGSGSSEASVSSTLPSGTGKSQPLLAPEDPFGTGETYSVEFPIHPSSYSTPGKKIHDQSDLIYFQQSIAYNRIQNLITSISQAVIQKFPADINSSSIHPVFKSIIEILQTLSKWCDEIEPVIGPRRFGNIAFRQWHTVLENRSGQLLTEKLAEPLAFSTIGDEMSDKVSAENSPLTELIPYFQGSFGSKQRLDFGTGHELSFLAFIGGLILLGVIDQPSGEDILLVFETYFEVIRKLVLRYTLEPAGSHGVWGLDDHFHLPYILGSAQLVDPQSNGIPKPSSIISKDVPTPRSVLDKASVSKYARTNLYFKAIDFVYQVKRGPFYEHSPILYDITGVPTWNKIYRGMIKMYNAEVLGKFPVVQHFIFGSALYPWKHINGNGLKSHSGEEEKAAPRKDASAVPSMVSSVMPLSATVSGVRPRASNAPRTSINPITGSSIGEPSTGSPTGGGNIPGPTKASWAKK